MVLLRRGRKGRLKEIIKGLKKLEMKGNRVLVGKGKKASNDLKGFLHCNVYVAFFNEQLPLISFSHFYLILN